DSASNVVSIVLYEDYSCPACKIFNDANAKNIQTYVEAGAATLEIHPIEMLYSMNPGIGFSHSGANAAACVANYSPDSFWLMNETFYSIQPIEEVSGGPSNAELVEAIAATGAKNMDKISTCIEKEKFSPWAGKATARALGKKPRVEKPLVNGTPTVYVNGTLYQGAINNADEFRMFITQVAGESASTTPATPAAG
ncbi:MAG: thioredoxin domain-containing protein, partial [Aurantimicrobium sp.]